ncbi:MAG: hypothetical protein LBC65_00475 [Oscillospiraceae bacterium]|nr:hypothetical protein [Oscillospiraceae bacterium]
MKTHINLRFSRVISAALSAIAVLALLSACGGSTISESDVEGIWRSDLGSAEQMKLSGGDYQLYNSFGDRRSSGQYALDGNCVVLDGKNKKDPDATMVLEYNAADKTFVYDSEITGRKHVYVKADAIADLSEDDSDPAVANETFDPTIEFESELTPWY